MSDPPAGDQRIDKWLWCARFAKSRTLAAGLVRAGHVRIDGRRAEGPDKVVRAGSVLTLALAGGVQVVQVLAPGLRRGPASEARTLYRMLDDAGA